MKNRRFSLGLAGLLVASVYVNAVACGDDSTDSSTPTDTTDASSSDVTTNDVVTADQSVEDHAAPQDVNTADVVDARGQEQTGQACTNVSQCYAGLDAAALKGTAVCLDKVTNGYCTHECTQDSDCCAVPGECKTGLKQVCSSFENSAKKYCFLSCEPADIAAAQDAGIDAGASGDTYCKSYASPEFGCRSTGGGSANRQVCLPTGTASDGGADADASDAMDAADSDG